MQGSTSVRSFYYCFIELVLGLAPLGFTLQIVGKYPEAH